MDLLRLLVWFQNVCWARLTLSRRPLRFQMCWSETWTLSSPRDGFSVLVRDMTISSPRPVQMSWSEIWKPLVSSFWFRCVWSEDLTLNRSSPRLVQMCWSETWTSLSSPRLVQMCWSETWTLSLLVWFRCVGQRHGLSLGSSSGSDVLVRDMDSLVSSSGSDVLVRDMDSLLVSSSGFRCVGQRHGLSLVSSSGQMCWSETWTLSRLLVWFRCVGQRHGLLSRPSSGSDVLVRHGLSRLLFGSDVFCQRHGLSLVSSSGSDVLVRDMTPLVSPRWFQRCWSETWTLYRLLVWFRCVVRDMDFSHLLVWFR